MLDNLDSIHTLDWATIAQTFFQYMVMKKRLELAKRYQDQQFEFADRELALAEKLFELHKALRIRDPEFFEIVNGATIYAQQYQCALDGSNAEVVHQLNRSMMGVLKNTSAYQSGVRRWGVETHMSNIVYESSGPAAGAYRSQDDFTDGTFMNKYDLMVMSVNQASLYVATDAMNQAGTLAANLYNVNMRSVTNSAQNIIDTGKAYVNRMSDFDKNNTALNSSIAKGVPNVRSTSTTSHNRPASANVVTRPLPQDAPVIARPNPVPSTVSISDRVSNPGGVGGV